MAGGQVSLGKYEKDQNDRAHEQSRGVNFQCGHKTLRRPNPWKKGAEVRQVKRCRIEAASSLPQLKGTHEHGSCPKLDRTLERFGQCEGVEGGSDGRQVCLKFFMRMESGQTVDGKRKKYERR